MTTPAQGQKQFVRALLVSDLTTPNTVDWTVFKTVLTVTNGNDSGNGSLRSKVNTAKTVAMTDRPILIQFDHAAVSTISLTGNINIENTPPASGDGPMIDGTDSKGDPSPTQPFASRKYGTVLNFTGPAKLSVYVPGVQLVGLSIIRSLGPDGAIKGQDLNVIGFLGNSLRSHAWTCLFDGGAAARTNADCPDGNTPADGKDCIDNESNGATSFTDAVVVENSEVRYCYDRAAKSQTAYLIMRDNWIHNNLRGGVFAQSPTGHMKTERNLLEQNGRNCPNAAMCSGGSRNGLSCSPGSACPGSTTDDGCPGGACVANPAFSGDVSGFGGTIVRTNASQMTAESATGASQAVELISDSDVQRNGAIHAIFLRSYATGSISNDFLCGMNTYGMEINFDTGSTQIGVLGTASVFSGYGAFFHTNTNGSLIGNVNFGSGGSFGKNAFVKNPSRNFALQSSGSFTARLAESNQWEHCGNTASCDLTAVGNSDVTGSADFNPAQAHRNPGGLTISTGGVLPKVVVKGSIVHIAGSGFNAIEGYTAAPATTDCATLKQGNTCTPVKGTCVEFYDPAAQQWTPADAILGITPTHLVVTSPFACSAPTKVRVRRLNSGGTEDKFEPSVNNFCLNS